MRKKCMILLALVLTITTVSQSTAVYATGNQTKKQIIKQEAPAPDEYQTRDHFFNLNDRSVNRMSSEHFQIIWGNQDKSGTVNEALVKGNLKNLENTRSFYVDVLKMKDTGISQNGNSGNQKFKTNVYIAETGLGSVVTDNWAYMSVDPEGFAYMCLMPGAMRVDEPSWVVPHELAHAFTYHQGGNVPHAWYEATANWFRDQFLGSKYYAYGGKTYGPTADFFAPYLLKADYYYPHLKNWYDGWPILLYISENPDNIKGLGMDLIHKFLENKQQDATFYATLERLSGVSWKDILANSTKRLVNMDFSRQKFYLKSLNDLIAKEGKDAIYTKLESTSDGYLQVPANRAPMQAGFNIVPLDADLSAKSIQVEFVNTSKAADADFRASIVTVTKDNKSNYSTVFNKGTNAIALNGNETAAYLVVNATPNNIQALDYNNENAQGTRYTYKIKVSASDKVVKSNVNNNKTEQSEDVKADTANKTTENTKQETKKEETKAPEKQQTNNTAKATANNETNTPNNTPANTQEVPVTPSTTNEQTPATSGVTSEVPKDAIDNDQQLTVDGQNSVTNKGSTNVNNTNSIDKPKKESKVKSFFVKVKTKIVNWFNSIFIR